VSEGSKSHHDESPFWRFSLRFYARPQVSAACLKLQDEAGVDVNLLLFLLFLAEHQRQVNLSDVARFDDTIRSWRESVVKPLRTLRRAMKTGIGDIPVTASENFRGQIKRLELESEQIEQHVLESLDGAALGVAAASRVQAAEANLAAYAAYLGGLSVEPAETILSAFASGLPHPV
jgi:uncharacterized protein (TIGR02444 family)